MQTRSLLALLALGLSACAGAPPVPQAAPLRPPDCPLEFLNKKPERPFEHLGQLLRHVTNVPPGGAQEALRPWACALGADAVIVERNQVLNLLDHAMVEGTAIKYLPPPATPVAPEPEPAPKPEDLKL